VANNLLISGGPLHDFDATSAALVDLLTEEGVRSTVFDDPHEALRALADRPGSWDLVTVNALRWQMGSERHAPLRDRWAFSLRDGEVETIERHVRAGGGLLACHTAAICFDGHPRWAACLGATWSWDRSAHPPQGPALISPTAAGRRHPITAGTPAFTTDDEIYGFLDQGPDLEALLTSAHGGSDHPVLWAHALGRGRVVTDLLGHDVAAMTQPEHRRILRNAARWLTALDPSDRPGPLIESDSTP
jgi:type 1 glutamine amidotransferase